MENRTISRRQAARDNKVGGKHETTERRAKNRAIVPKAWRRKTGPARSLFESFFHAFHGIWIGLKQERNVRIHFALAIAATAMGIWLKLDPLSWTLLIVAIAMVLVTEFFNTSLEHLADLAADGQYAEAARFAKDTAAAAVLIAAVSAALIGGSVFVPRLLPLIHL